MHFSKQYVKIKSLVKCCNGILKCFICYRWATTITVQTWWNYLSVNMNVN
jgi:hypothetical protein